jgi:capsular polysaccharide biosynthesis protein
MQHEISFSLLWKCLKKSWVIMLVAAIVMALIVGIFVNFIPKNYSSTVEFYVINTNTSYDYTTSALLAASQYLINDYVEIIRSDAVLEKVADHLNQNRPSDKQVTPDRLRGMISSSSSSNTSIFTIRVTHTDPKFAYEVACAIEEIAPAAVTDIAKPDRLTNEYLVEVVWQSLDSLEKKDDITRDDIEILLKDLGLDGSLDCFTTVNSPVVDRSPDSPNVKKYALYAAAATAVLVYAIFLIKGLLEMNVSSEDDVKKFVNRPLVGTIPHWENSSKK